MQQQNKQNKYTIYHNKILLVVNKLLCLIKGGLLAGEIGNLVRNRNKETENVGDKFTSFRIFSNL